MIPTKGNDMESMTQSVQATMILPRFGEISFDDTDVIEFPMGLPGFPTLHRWLFLTLDSAPSFVWLQSLDDLGVAIPAANPWMIFEEYDPQIPAYAFASLKIADASEFTVLCVVTVTAGAKEMTMNLAAPILVNLRTRQANQIALNNGRYSGSQLIPRKQKECA